MCASQLPLQGRGAWVMLTTPSPQDTCGSEVTGGRRGDPLIIAPLRQLEQKQDSDTINLLFVIYNWHFPHYVMEAGRPQRLSPAPGLLSQHLCWRRGTVKASLTCLLLTRMFHAGAFSPSIASLWWSRMHYYETVQFVEVACVKTYSIVTLLEACDS